MHLVDGYLWPPAVDPNTATPLLLLQPPALSPAARLVGLPTESSTCLANPIEPGNRGGGDYANHIPDTHNGTLAPCWSDRHAPMSLIWTRDRSRRRLVSPLLAGAY